MVSLRLHLKNPTLIGNVRLLKIATPAMIHRTFIYAEIRKVGMVINWSACVGAKGWLQAYTQEYLQLSEVV